VKVARREGWQISTKNYFYTTTIMNDITQRVHIEKLVNAFYHKVNRDDLLAPLFAHVDWPKHLPVMYRFWASLLLGERSYDGNPFEKHMRLSLQAGHFERWLMLFHQTVDELYAGEMAAQAKDRALSIARVWQHKLGVKG
jgi:hemoglobin